MELCESTEADLSRWRGAGGGLVALAVGEAEYSPRRVGAERVERGDPVGTGSLPATSPIILHMSRLKFSGNLFM